MAEISSVGGLWIFFGMTQLQKVSRVVGLDHKAAKNQSDIYEDNKK